MSRFETSKYYRKYSVLGGMAYGAIGGIVAGSVMAPFLMASAAAAGLPAYSILAAYGLAFGAPQDNAVAAGIGLHLLASALIGVIFGSVTSISDRLRITGIGRGIVEGFVAGMIAFVVLFIPFIMFAMPAFLAQIILVTGPELGTTEQGQALLQQAMLALISLSVADHLIFGAVLGTVMAAFLVGVRKRGRREAINADSQNLQPEEPRHVCPACQRQFATAQELEEHRQTLHHSGAAA